MVAPDSAETPSLLEGPLGPAYRPFIALPIRFFPQWGYIAGVLDSTHALTDDPAMKEILKKAIEYIDDNNIALNAAARIESTI